MTQICLHIFMCHLTNLELMKISSYYKKKMEIVNLSPSFSPNMYNKFIYRKDYYDGIFPSEIFKNNNIEYGGLAFNQENYVSLSEDIEKQKPDIFIYENIRKKFCTNFKMKEAFNTLMRAEHFRLSLDNKTIWNNFEKQINIVPSTQVLFLHDYNLNNIENSDLIISDLMKNMAHKYLAVKFPIQVDNDLDLFKWCNFKPTEKFFLLQYNGIMSDELLIDFIEKQKGTTISKQLDYYITRNITEEELTKEYIQKIFKQIAYLREQRKLVNIKYDVNFFTDKRWEKVIDLLNMYLKSTINLPLDKFNRVIKYDSLYSFACSINDVNYIKTRTFNKAEVRELFQFVRINNYELFKDFYECHTVKLKGGTFQNE